jgi:hypothetical protein
MSDHDVDKAIIDSITSKIRERYPGENLNNMPCIICGTETVSTCTYCFFFKIENILMSLNIPEEMIMHFLQIFNYKLYHEVFTKEED